MNTKLKGWWSTKDRAWCLTWQGSSRNLVSAVTCSRAVEITSAQDSLSSLGKIMGHHFWSPGWMIRPPGSRLLPKKLQGHESDGPGFTSTVSWLRNSNTLPHSPEHKPSEHNLWHQIGLNSNFLVAGKLR